MKAEKVAWQSAWPQTAIIKLPESFTQNLCRSAALFLPH